MVLRGLGFTPAKEWCTDAVYAMAKNWRVYV
jgi:hypothetical protein